MINARPKYLIQPGSGEEKIFDMAIQQVRKKKYQHAVSILQTLVKIVPNEPRVWWYFGGTYLWNLGDPTSAERCFRRAVVLDPISRGSSVGLFHSFCQQGKLPAAIREVRRFLALKSSQEHEILLKESLAALAAQRAKIRKKR